MIFIVLQLLLQQAAQSAIKEYMYVPTRGGLLQYKISDTGILVPLQPKVVHLHGLAWSPTLITNSPRKTLYAIASSPGINGCTIWTLRIFNNGTAHLMEKGSLRSYPGINIQQAVVGASGSDLYASNQQTGLMQFKVLSTGILSTERTVMFSIPADIKDLAIDSGVDGVFVQNRTSLLEYHILADGRLSFLPNTVIRRTSAPICIDKPLHLLFIQGAGRPGTVFRTSSSGVLANSGSAYPSALISDSAIPTIAFDGSGKFAFAVFRAGIHAAAHIAIYSVHINGATALVNSMAAASFNDAVPAVDPSGRFLITTSTYSQQSSAISVYQILHNVIRPANISLKNTGALYQQTTDSIEPALIIIR